MPKHLEEVLHAFYHQNYAEVNILISTHPELVNSVDEECGDSLMQLAISGSTPGDECQSLLNSIITHPQFNFTFKNRRDVTNLTSIISNARLDLLTLVIRNPHVLINEIELTYASAKKQLAHAEVVLQKDIGKNPSSKSSERGRIKVANLNEMVSMLRDASIMYAIEADNAELLNDLRTAGGEPTSFLGKLGKEELPSMLVKPTNTNIRAWFKASSDKSTKALTTSTHSFHAEVKGAEEVKAVQLTKLEREHLEKRAAIMHQAAESKNELVRAITAAV